MTPSERAAKVMDELWGCVQEADELPSQLTHEVAIAEAIRAAERQAKADAWDDAIGFVRVFLSEQPVNTSSGKTVTIAKPGALVQLLLDYHPAPECSSGDHTKT
jgi:hypothetical protein